MYVMRPLRNFKTNQCCHLISRIANRAFFLWLSVDDEKQQKARRRDVSRFEQSLPDRVPLLLEKLRGDSPSLTPGHASPPAVSFRRHLPVKLSHWHRPTDSVGRLLVCPPRRTGPYAACLRGSSQMNARQRFTDRLPAFGKCLGRKSLTFFRKPKSAEM